MVMIMHVVHNLNILYLIMNIKKIINNYMIEKYWKFSSEKFMTEQYDDFIVDNKIVNELNRTKDGFDNERAVNNIIERVAKLVRYYLKREPVIVPIIIEEE